MSAVKTREEEVDEDEKKKLVVKKKRKREWKLLHKYFLISWKWTTLSNDGVDSMDEGQPKHLHA